MPLLIKFLLILVGLVSQFTFSYYPDSDWVQFDGARQRGEGVAALAPQPEANAPGEFERVPFGREDEQTDHYGNTKSMAYDARGNVTVQTIGASLTEDPANPTTGYTTRTIYNDRSAPTTITDPDGRVQTFTYDPTTNDLLTHTVGVGGTAPATTTYSYNDDGTLDTITDALGKTEQKTEQREPSKGVRLCSLYFKNGAMVWFDRAVASKH